MENSTTIDTSKININLHHQNLRKSDNNLDFIQKRNHRLIALFISILPNNNIKLFGSEDKPGVIYENDLLLSCHTKNFDLIFTDSPNFNSNIIKTIKLQQKIQITSDDINFIKNWITNLPHKKVYKIKAFSNLYLCGYNSITKGNTQSKYPVFAPCNPRLYLKKEYAQRAGETLNSYNINYTIE